MEGYYDDTIIHRIVPRFIVQAGDPTGSGTGGESIYGEPFKDEYHSRIRFTQRGLLAMANTAPNQNNSQFFFTLDAAPALNGRNTIFGKVVGNTVFNLLKLGELETDKEDKPIYDAKIISAVILSNPFDDIEPRSTREERQLKKEEADRIRIATEKASKPKGTKNRALLSFSGDGDAPNTLLKARTSSSHDMQDGRLSSTPAIDISVRQETMKRKLEEEVDKADEVPKKLISNRRVPEEIRASGKGSLSDQIKKLQGEIKQIGVTKKQAMVEVKQEKGSVARMRKEFLATGRAVHAVRKSTKGDVDAKLRGFEEALKEAAKNPSAKVVNPTESSEKDQECSLHFIYNCASCKDTFGDQLSEDDDDWMNTKLKFVKPVGANVYEPKIDDYTVIDPRKGAKADPFGRDIQGPSLGDIKVTQSKIWRDKSTRNVRSVIEQASEAPEYQRYQ